MSIFLLTSLKTFSFGSSESLVYEAKNNYDKSTLYIKNTDPDPGTVNGGDGQSTFSVHTGDNSPNFAYKPNRYVVPYDRFGGKIYLWLVDDNTKKIINAAILYDKENHVYFKQDPALVEIKAGQITSTTKSIQPQLIQSPGQPDMFDLDKSKYCNHPPIYINVDQEGKISANFGC